MFSLGQRILGARDMSKIMPILWPDQRVIMKPLPVQTQKGS